MVDLYDYLTFDIEKSPSKTGTLGQLTLKRSDFSRTAHPIYSFSVFGKYKDGNHMDICGNCILIDIPSEIKIKEILQKVIIDKEYYKQLKYNANKSSDSLSYYKIAQKSLEGLN